MNEFVIYLGTEKVVTISDPKLSKIYRLEKNRPVEVKNINDKRILLNYKEKKRGGCGTCGKSIEHPIKSDLLYCQIKNLDVGKFRTFWTEYYEGN